MEISGTDVSEARIVNLEQKVRDMEALAKGLVEETLDLKSVFIGISKVEESSRRELRNGPVVRGATAQAFAGQSASPSGAATMDGSTVIRQRSAQPEIPAGPAEPAMVRIMQSDGTMKMEARRGDQHQTDSTGGYRQARRANLSRAGKTQ